VYFVESFSCFSLFAFIMAESGTATVFDPPVVESVPTATKLQRFLRKARGQIDRPAPAQTTVSDSKTPYSSESPKLDSFDGSGRTSLVGGEQQAQGDVYASGGLTKFYEPIPEYEGRHRWDPHAEWTEDEEKRLVRKVSCFQFHSTFHQIYQRLQLQASSLLWQHS
jgi:hypothetical protein